MGKKREGVIAVAVSGGVDSLVSGYLLKQKFKTVFGLHFITGYERHKTDIPLLEKQLGFPVTTIDLTDVFEKKVVQYFIRTYLEGKTPNPCMICNKVIKFGELLSRARDMGADFLATGHYADIITPDPSLQGKRGQAYLKKGADPLKDQSYFLSLLSGDQLEKIVFPLAGMIKKDVIKYAASERIAPVHPKESQDICFIHDNNFSRFILEKEGKKPTPGNIVNNERKVVGRHNGLHQFTIGQRRGLNCPSTEPYYVKKIDIRNNILEVCFKKDLSQKECRIDNINWNYRDQTVTSNILTRIRYRHKGVASTLIREGTKGKVIFDEPQNAVTPGQAAVFYRDDRVLGAGIIQ